ncbi:MAG: LPS export ABC transporter periplasmic protein LptC, partial [Ignavibacteriales bacterium]|nr:LPS export ABC transporter periplasmic protein LptC [Ignavibacteriales bacterium]
MSRLFYFLLVLAAPIIVCGQSKVIELKHADELQGRIVNGEEVRELIRNVHFLQPAEGGGFVRVWCDRALQYRTQNKIELFGNVKIIRDSITITSQEGTYFGDTRFVEVRTGVKLVRGRSVLTAKTGKYYSDEKRSHFTTNVKLVDSMSTVTCDTMIYFERDARSIAVGNVRLDDVENASTVFGDSLLHFEQRRFTLVPKNPRLLQIDTAADGAIDSMLVTSRSMESYQDPTQRFVALDSVKIARGDLAATAGR